MQVDPSICADTNISEKERGGGRDQQTVYCKTGAVSCKIY